jgi:putative ABC transport system substrate-binding protein
MFSMMFVQASERRNSAGRPSLLTVRISSNPSRILFETPGAPSTGGGASRKALSGEGEHRATERGAYTSGKRTSGPLRLRRGQRSQGRIAGSHPTLITIGSSPDQHEGSRMRRREFIAGLGAAITGSIQTNAQELALLPLVGHLDDGPVEGFVFRQVLFREGLAVVDYYEGCNVAIESHRGRLAYWASDLVERGVAVLVASGSVAAILAAKAATKTIPIVFGFGADPIETGLVSSLDHPGGNITGITSMTMGMGSKRLALLPRAARVAVLVDPSEDATVVNSMIADVRGAAISMGRDIEVFYAGNIGDIDTAFANLVEKRSEVLLVSPSSFFSSQRMEIIALAAQHRVPALYFDRDFAEAGGLMSYGPNIPTFYRQLGNYAGRILSGQKPGDLPVSRATRSEFLINLKTAKALGLIIPQTLLAIADEVIQ